MPQERHRDDVSMVSDAEKDDKRNSDEGSEGEEGEEEYEIEAILEAKKGVFGNGKLGYLVKWKNYGAEHNSWVVEDDAQNASELIDDYWRRQHKKKTPRKSTDAKPNDSAPSSKRGGGSEGRDSPAAPAAPAKRGRKPRQSREASVSVEDAAMEEDEDEQPKKKRPKQAENGKVPKKTVGQARQDEDEGKDGAPKEYSTMEKYMSHKTWENLVKRVNTVERTEDDQLMVYFELTTGELIRESSTLCAKRFPQKMIKFYESHLRWRQAEGGEAEGEQEAAKATT